jgi:purine-binding chemotaxis protein CheW
MSEEEKSSSKRISEIFGSFYLSDSEFALAVRSVQEVVNAPANYTAVPLAPPYLKGLFNLRGMVVPVLGLRELLNLQKDEGQKNQKIAIIELEGTCVGLLFDKTGEVFKSNENERSDFESAQGSDVVCGVFKKDSGKRIVQILDVTKLFRLQNVPKEMSVNRIGRELRNRGNRKKCISFVVGPAKCALAISDIHEILKIEKLNESALGVGFCIGSIDLRGTTVPVIDFAAFLNYRGVDRSETATHGDRRLVVMRLEDELFGLLVDSVESIISYFSDELLPFPLVEQKRVQMFLGCISGHGSSDILLLDHQKILDSSEVSEITRGHSKIYQSRSSHKADEKSKGGARRTYITFSIDGSYAVGIHDIREIIDYPQHLLQPPGMKKHVRGVLNLRGDLVTIIDARSMYSAAEQASDSKEHQKVLVFKQNNIHFGLVVDSVESIVTFSEKDKVKLPEILYSGGENSMSCDIAEAVEVTDAGGMKRNILILSAESVATRASKSIAA